MPQKKWLDHILHIRPFVQTVEECTETRMKTTNTAAQKQAGPLRRLYQIKHMNGLFALVIIPYLFLFHGLLGKQLIALFQMLSRNIFPYNLIMLLLIFVMLPLALYFLVLHFANHFWCKHQHYQEKIAAALSAQMQAEQDEAQTRAALLANTTLPTCYLHSYALQKFEQYFRSHRAETLRDAIHLFEIEKNHALQQYTLYRMNGEKRIPTSFTRAYQFEQQQQPS
ncbi:hypothetical protein NSQ26_13245 [Bacillus sp. FSL W7-1360]